MDQGLAGYTLEAWQLCFRRMAALLGRPLSDRQCVDLHRYSILLMQANQRFNLMGPSAERDFLSRHLLDSVPLMPFFAEQARVADIGSGGGLPGIVLAILFSPSQTIHLIESVSKKARFLQGVVAELALQERTRVFALRAEHWDKAEQNAYDYVVSRALGSLVYGARLSRLLLRPGGAYLALKGRTYAADIEVLRKDPVQRFFREPQVFSALEEGGGVIVQLTLKN